MRVVLTQQTDTLRLLQSQDYQTSQDSAELTGRAADQAASAFRSVYSTNSSGNAAPTSTGSARPATVRSESLTCSQARPTMSSCSFVK